MTTSPLVGITACNKSHLPLPYQMVGQKYVDAIVSGSEATPVLIPALGHALDADGLIDRLDGLFLTGSPSNVHPRHYRAELEAAETLLDPARDDSSFALVRLALARQVPLLAVCRGFQELNVVLGGTLHQFVHLQPGLRAHFARDEDPLEVQYGPAHPVRLREGGFLSTLLGGKTRIEVNSLHSQGVRDLAPALTAEAWAEDGLVEAVRVSDAATFAFGVQWHPEWRVLDNPDALPIFRAFGEACRARQRARA